MEKLDKPIKVRNIDRSDNKKGSITYEVKVNMYYKGHVERVRMNVCKLGKTKVILGMLWLAAHNPEINWKMGEVRMTRCLSLCRHTPEKKVKRQLMKKKERDLRWTIEERERKEEIVEDHRKVEELVLRCFYKWRKVFGKVESE